MVEKLRATIAVLRQKLAERDRHIEGIASLLDVALESMGVEKPPSDLHLGDVIEKYLLRAVSRRIEKIVRERDGLRERLVRLEDGR